MHIARPLLSTRAILMALLTLNGFASLASAEPQVIDAIGTFSLVDGSFSPDFAVGDAFDGTFTYDVDEANASSAITTPSTVPGHEFSSFYEFSGAPYGVFIEFPAIPDEMDVTFVGVVVNDDLTLTSAETNGAVPDGTYDWIELLGSTTVDVCLVPGGGCAPDEFSPADGVEFTVALISDSTWFTDGSVIPDTLPASFTPVFVGIEYDAGGVETGAVFGTPAITVNEAFNVPSVGRLGLGVLVVLCTLLGVRFFRETENPPDPSAA